jgi:hypothetical protein
MIEIDSVELRDVGVGAVGPTLVDFEVAASSIGMVSNTSTVVVKYTVRAFSMT